MVGGTNGDKQINSPGFATHESDTTLSAVLCEKSFQAATFAIQQQQQTRDVSRGHFERLPLGSAKDRELA